MEFKESLKEFDLGIQKFYEDPEYAKDLFQMPDTGNWEDRFSIYGTGYSVRTQSSLEDIFELFRGLLSEEEWFALGGLYVQTHPSISPNISDIGNSFPQFLKENDFRVELFECADFELKIWNSFHAFDEISQMNEEKISQLNDTSIFKFQNSVYLQSYSHSIANSWIDRDSKILEAKEFSLIYRNADFECQAKILSEPEFKFLERLKSGKTLGEALQASVELANPASISDLLRDLIQLQLVYDYI